MSFAATRAALITYLENEVMPISAVTAVFDGSVPEGAKPQFPYLTLPDSIETDDRTTLGKPGDDHLITIRVWGLKRVGNQWIGTTQVATIAALIELRLSVVKLLVPGHQVRVRRESTMLVPDPDPRIASVSLQVRVRSRAS